MSVRGLPATAPAKPLSVRLEKARIDCSHDAISRHSADQTTPNTNSIYQV
ncbi:hypothetical protein OCAR_6459 [Afipia carboxidovorans OM5]|nr:hypothetical protein OCAR_6459 [Afipia carboxidovorans OM5]